MDSEFELFAKAAIFLREEIEKPKKSWEKSPFKWILYLPSATKGKLGKRLISQWGALKGLSINKSPDSDADLLINNHRIEIKLSILWATGNYKFQQIRDQNFEYAIFLGISPMCVHCWVIKKQILLENVIGKLGQHTGKSGKETSWVTINPTKPLSWLNNCGGTLKEAFILLENL